VDTSADTQVYRDLIRLKPEGLSFNAWAVAAGVSRTVWADMRRHGNPSRRTLEKLLAAAGSSLAEFEALRISPSGASVAPGPAGGVGDAVRGWGPPPAARLPLVASSLAGEWGEAGDRVELTALRRGEVIAQLPRPASLAGDGDAFAMTIVGNGMWPRFRPGVRVAVSPRLPVAIGDDVLLELHGSAGQAGTTEVLIMQLVRRTGAGFELRQFNPDRTIEIGTAKVAAVLKILGELI